MSPAQYVQVTPSVPIDSQRTGSYATLNVDVTWTDPSKQRTIAIGQHDVYLLAVDKSILLLQGDNDISPARVSGDVGCWVWLCSRRMSDRQTDRQTDRHR